MIELLGVAPQHFGYSFMLVISGYMLGSWLSARLVMRIGMPRTLFAGIVSGLLGSAVLLGCALTATLQLAPVIGGVFFCFVASGLCLSNSQMGAISEFPLAAGGASAVFGFLQTAMGAAAGLVVGQSYDGSLLPIALTMLGGVLCSALGFALLRRSNFGAAAMVRQGGG